MQNSNPDPLRRPPGYPEFIRRPLPRYSRIPRRRRRWRWLPRYRPPRRRRRTARLLGCLFLVIPVMCLVLVAGIYTLFPLRTDVLLIGIDYAEPPSYAARSDTLILTTIEPSSPYIGMLSIPRDLWVTIPGVGENRINTAHFYAEAAQPGSGPGAAMETVGLNFGIEPDYYMRIRFEGFRDVVEPLGGVEIELTKPTAGYAAGKHYLRPRKALAFVRHRATSDDFTRMSNGQFMLRALWKNMLYARNWIHIPAVYRAFTQVVDTNIPKWLWPRFGIALLRLGANGIDSRIITRDMVTPIITDSGASVLLPNWQLIKPVLDEMFGR